MKKIFSLTLLTLFLMLFSFVIFPIKVFAITPDGNAEDWYNFITQFEDGYSSATIEFIEEWENDELFAVIINESPENEFDGYYLQYDTSENEHAFYFDVLLSSGISIWMAYGRTQGSTLKEVIEGIALEEGIIIDFDETIYWNFEEKVWQIEPYGTPESENNILFSNAIVNWLVLVVMIVITGGAIKSIITNKGEKRK